GPAGRALPRRGRRRPRRHRPADPGTGRRARRGDRLVRSAGGPAGGRPGHRAARRRTNRGGERRGRAGRAPGHAHGGRRRWRRRHMTLTTDTRPAAPARAPVATRVATAGYRYGLLVVLVAVTVFFGTARSSFATYDNLLIVLQSVAIVAI